jgi:hypothetical protein
MSKKQKEQTITIDDKEYKVSDLSQEQIMNVNYCQDLQRKLDSARFNVQQLEGGYKHFLNRLTASL